jgi:hypothetical protein
MGTNKEKYPELYKFTQELARDVIAKINERAPKIKPDAQYKQKIVLELLISESPRAHWLRRARKLGSPLLATGLASINKKFLIGDRRFLAACCEESLIGNYRTTLWILMGIP